MRLSDYEYLTLALEEADQALIEGTYPIGAIIVDADGNVVSRGRNRVFSECDPTAHAEVDAIRQAGQHLLDVSKKRYTKNDLTLYTTCEPCPMCSCTILMSGIKRSYGQRMMKGMAGFDVSRRDLILSICSTHYPVLQHHILIWKIDSGHCLPNGILVEVCLIQSGRLPNNEIHSDIHTVS